MTKRRSSTQSNFDFWYERFLLGGYFLFLIAFAVWMLYVLGECLVHTFSYANYMKLMAVLNEFEWSFNPLVIFMWFLRLMLTVLDIITLSIEPAVDWIEWAVSLAREVC